MRLIKMKQTQIFGTSSQLLHQLMALIANKNTHTQLIVRRHRLERRISNGRFLDDALQCGVGLSQKRLPV